MSTIKGSSTVGSNPSAVLRDPMLSVKVTDPMPPKSSVVLQQPVQSEDDSLQAMNISGLEVVLFEKNTTGADRLPLDNKTNPQTENPEDGFQEVVGRKKRLKRNSFTARFYVDDPK